MACIAPAAGQPARLAWYGQAGDEASPQRLDVHHVGLLEDFPDHRMRILTQETQKGAPARVLADTRPSPMLNGHQTWLDGLISAAGQAR